MYNCKSRLFPSRCHFYGMKKQMGSYLVTTYFGFQKISALFSVPPYNETRGHGKLRLSRWNFRQNWQKWLNLLQTFFMSPKFMQKCSKMYGFSLKTSAKQRFLFSLLLKRKCINQEKLNVKTLLRPYIKRTHQSYQLLLCHLGMLWTQTEGVRLGI